MSKSDDKTRVLGDDPLAWLSAGTNIEKKSDKKSDKKRAAAKNKAGKIAKPGSIGKTAQAKVVADAPAVVVEQPEAAAVEQPKAGAEEKQSRLVLESSLVINKASEVYDALKKLSASGDAVEIDASKVETIDSAILQLLLAFVLSLKDRRINLSWHKPSEGMLYKASVLGLTGPLGL